MKIGILTFHRAHNYGAVLQCYALKRTLEKMGHNVWVIDYRQKHIEKIYKTFSIQYLGNQILHPRKALKYIKDTNVRKSQKKNFEKFQNQYLNLTKPCNRIVDKFDYYIIGSDQMWGLHCTGGLDPIYFGEFPHPPTSKIIGYAISSNLKSIQSIEPSSLLKYTKNFHSLSFRENEIYQAVKKITNIEGRIDVDPVLLTDSSFWDTIIQSQWKREKYILVYQARYPKTNLSILMEKAKELAMKENCKVINLSNKLYSPEDFVSLIKYAQCVITSSFHATIFSIIFERPLYSVKLNDGHDGRYESLLNKIGGKDLLVECNFTPTIKKIDYSEIRTQLAQIKQESIKYLENEI